MALPRPEPGLVISYAYLWHHEHRRGREEGMKARPCAIVLATSSVEDDIVVTVAPIMHRPPDDSATAVALTAKVKRHLGLDDVPSWIVADEVRTVLGVRHQFPNLPGGRTAIAYGRFAPGSGRAVDPPSQVSRGRGKFS